MQITSTIPSGAIDCGRSTFVISGAPTAAAARARAAQSPSYVPGQVIAAVKRHRRFDPDLDIAGCVLDDSEPTQLMPGSWHFGFTTYVMPR